MSARERDYPRLHPLIWPLWLVGALLAAGTNPLHNLLLLGGAAFVALVCRTGGAVGRAFGLFLRIGLVLVVLRVLLAAVAVGEFRYGETTIGRLPVLRLPWWLGGLSLGGPFTLEMIVAGAVTGLRLLVILVIFGAFNSAADHYGLLRRVPHFLGGAGLAVTIALLFVPQTLRELAAIREAQRVRGHRFRGWRDALPLLAPLVAGGIERSLQLAEAMDSRGYGARHRPSGLRGLLEQLATFAGAALLALGLFTLFYETAPLLATAALALALLLLGAVAQSLGRSTRRSRYLRERWRVHDSVAATAAVLLGAGAMLARALQPAALAYQPFPSATVPPFEPVSLVLLLLLIAPAMLTLVLERQHLRARPAPIAAAR